MIIAANFKTNMTRAQTAEYYEKVSGFMTEKGISSEAMIFPPATALDNFEGAITVGAQNAFAVENGAYTGEIGLDQLDEFGIRTILIGHSERRHILGESQELIIEKFNYYKAKGFTIVYCIGEPIEVREEGNEALMGQISDILTDRQLVLEPCDTRCEAECEERTTAYSRGLFQRIKAFFGG